MLEQAKFTHYLLGKVLKKQIKDQIEKTIKDQGEHTQKKKQKKKTLEANGK